MTQAEWVTEFKAEENGKPVKIEKLIRALNAYLKSIHLSADEYDFCVAPSIRYDAPDTTIPTTAWNWIAYAVEGSSEGYYVHVGALTRTDAQPTYLDFGFAKTYSPENAYALAREAQRFLSAARWN